MSDLKQMQFVDDISTRAVKMAESTYSAVRQRTPKFLDPHVASVEGTLQPYYAKAGDMSSSMLKSVDATVDSGVQSACGMIDGTHSRVKEYTSSPRARFQKAREDTTSGVSDMYAFVKEKGVRGCTAALADKLGKTSENLQKSAVAATGSLYTYSTDTLSSSWTYLNEKPATKPFATKASELSEFALGYYSKLHDTIVENSLYAKLFMFSSGCLSKLVLENPYVTKPVTSIHSTVHPYVQYIADPAVEAVMPIVDAAVKHIQPTYTAKAAAPKDEEVVTVVHQKVADALPESGVQLTE